MASPEASLDMFKSLFVAVPDGAHAPGVEWGATATQMASSPMMFTMTSVLSLPATDTVTVTSKGTWAPPKEVTAHGAVAEGGGTRTATYSRKDGLPIRIEEKVFLKIEADGRKTNSRVDYLFERVAAPAKATPDPVKPNPDTPTPTPTKK